MKNSYLRKLSLALILTIFVSAGSATVNLDIRDSSGDDLDDFDLEVSGEDVDIERQNLDSAELDLEGGEYDLEIRKEDFNTLRRTISIEEDEDSIYIFTMSGEDEEPEEETEILQVSNLRAPDSVCRGQSFSATVKVSNTGEEDEVVRMTGEGLDKILTGNSFVIESGKSKNYRFIFTDIDGSGSENFTVTASNSETDSITGEIDVRECDVPGDPETVSNIDMSIYPLGGNDRAFVNEVVRVKGFADGSRGSVPLDLLVDGEKISDIQTGRGGYFETYFRPGKAGRLTVTVAAPESSEMEELNSVPSPSVGEISAPSETFSGDSFEVCSEVESAITPEVVLLENENVLESRNSKGEVCFDVIAPEAGEYSYKVRALSYGGGDSSETYVNVLEQGSEASSFPGQVTTVENEAGLLKVSLYNTGNQSKNYTVRMENFPANWTSETVKNATLDRGERKNVFFYVSPGESGNYTGILEVESSGEIIYSDEVEMYSSPAKSSRDRSFLSLYLDLITYLFL